MDEQRQQRVGDSEKAPALGERDQVPAPLGLLGRVGSSGGVEQRELQDALRRLTHHLERDVAAHRESRESEFLEGCVPKRVGGDFRHGFRAGMIRDPAIRDRGKRRELRPPHQLVAEQTGNEDEARFCAQSHDDVIVRGVRFRPRSEMHASER